jgi:hypothetical protein
MDNFGCVCKILCISLQVNVQNNQNNKIILHFSQHMTTLQHDKLNFLLVAKHLRPLIKIQHNM